MNNQRIDYPRICLILAGIVGGVGVGFFAECRPEALRILVTVLSILTAMLVTLITLVGDPQSLLSGSWRLASEHSRAIGRILRRYTLLAVIYLIAIFCAFLASAGLDASVSNGLGQIAIGLGAAALIWSFGLPIAIYIAQKKLLDEEVERRHNTPEGEAVVNT